MAEKKVYVMSGSFNPLTYGHLAVANYVESQYYTEVVFEFCRTPYDKAALSDDDVKKRLDQFRLLRRRCVVTANTSYVQKSVPSARALYTTDFPCIKYETVFCVGGDVINRIDDLKYYFYSFAERDRCLNIIKSNNCSFLVFERPGFTTEKLSPIMASMCEFVGDDFVPVDISSSQIREETSYKLPITVERPMTDLEKYANRKDFS